MHYDRFPGDNGGERGPCGGIKSGRIIRFGISADPRLLENFDKMIADKGYVNRSEAIRDIIRNQLIECAWTTNSDEMVGTITLVYKHGSKKFADKLTDLQHQNHMHILSTLHIHLDKHNCMEVLVVKGRGQEIKSISDRLIGTKGVKHGKLTMTTSGNNLF